MKRDNKYLVLLADRKSARIFMVHSNGAVEQGEQLINGTVPQKVKHGEDSWDAQDKIFRHIEDHLRQHLMLIAQRVKQYAAKNPVYEGMLIGGHGQLLPKIKKHLPYPLSRKLKGTFIADIKAPFNETLKRIKTLIDKIEKEQ